MLLNEHPCDQESASVCNFEEFDILARLKVNLNENFPLD